MAKNSTKSTGLFVEISHLNEPQSRWIWWVLQGDPQAPREGSRAFTSLRTLQEYVHSLGHHPPSAAQVNEAVIQARSQGKDDAVLQVKE